MPPLLAVSQLHVRRGDTTLLHGLDWRVARGEHWVIMGPNGGGKTTLLRTLAGYLTPSAGAIQLLGAHWGQTDWRNIRARLGIVSVALQPAIPGAEPVWETVVSGRYAQLDFWATPTPADLAAARREMLRLGILALAERPWAYLSQGERQRVLIARALMARPALLILDEPCAGLDPLARAQFLTLVEALARRPRGPALVLVTHHVEEITPAFSRVLLLARGRAVAQGPRRTVLTSAQLGEAFAAPMRLRRRGKGYALDPVA
jgi:iron complex transport system ATP-binding protein